MTTLYKLDSKGKIREWTISLDKELTPEGWCVIRIVHGQKDGKKQTKLRYVKAGKNIGKVNETTVLSQAESEVQSLIQSQLDGSYVYDIKDYNIPKQPQLAFKYDDKKHTLDWITNTYYASRKLNGIRCFVFIKNGKVVKYQSRTGKDFKQFPHITKDIEQYLNTLDSSITEDCIFDGEIFHPKMPFEFIASNTNSSSYNVNKDDNGITWSTDQLQLHAYDFINLKDECQNYKDRFLTLSPSQITHFTLVENIKITNEQELIKLATEWIKQGYEGLMIRDSSAPYDFGKRTKYLLKYKVMHQEEFLIKDVYLAENDNDKVMCTVENKFNTTEPYNTFECSIKGSKKLNMSLYTDKSTTIGKYLSINYQALSAYNVPLFPVGVGVREGRIVDGIFVPAI